MCCFLPVELFYDEINVQNSTNKSRWKSPVLSPSSRCLLVSAPLVQTQSVKKFQPPHPRLLSPCHLPPSCFFFFSLSLYPSTPSQTPIHTNSCIVSQTNSLLSVPSAPSPLHPARHINPSAAARHPGTDTPTSTFAIMLWKSRSKTDGLQVKKKKEKERKEKKKGTPQFSVSIFAYLPPPAAT